MNKIFIVLLIAVFSCDRPSSTDNSESKSLGDSQIIRTIDSRGAESLLDSDEEIILLDVRTPEEYEEGHLAGAKNIDYNAPNFAEQIQQLDRNQKYLLYCAVGGRSGKSLKIMEEMGFKEVYNVSEGFKELREQGIPVSPVEE